MDVLEAETRMATLTSIAVSHKLIQEMAEARRQTDDLFAIVAPDSLYERPIAERHRIVFYIGHLEAFDWNLLHDRVLGLKSFNPGFDQLFAFGIDPVDGGLPSDQPSQWPSIDTVRDYVSKIRGTLDEALQNALDSDSYSGRDGFPLGTLLNVAVEHRLMHAETLAYMLHQLPLNHKIRQSEPVELAGSTIDYSVVEVPAGPVTLGLARGAAFGWDNEFEAHTVDVPAFSVDKYKTTNGQYLEFLNDGGYENANLWAPEDWEWRAKNGISQPAFWKRDGEQWLYRTMFNDIPLPPAWPVYVSQAEAKAYANWAGKMLPTEAQWQRAASGTPSGEQRFYPWGNDEPSAKFGNFDFTRWNPTAVSAFSAGGSAFGVHGILGNGWEWTSSQFTPFPGFEAFPFYPGYSANFFDGKHFVMKGGSARTAACMLRPTFRNWFQAHYQFIYTGFRCISR
jgi:gamma-glutamyl hercynylcysteine S-oxide synthase